MSKRERTQVGIIGAGPAGLLLARLLEVHGIESVILEARTLDYVEARIRAGVLEQGTVALLEEAGVAERLHREGLVHDGAEIAVGGRRVRIDFRALTGKTVTVYGQTEMTTRPDRRAPGRRRPDRLGGGRRRHPRHRDRSGRGSATGTPAPNASWSATSSPAATASMASAVRPCRHPAVRHSSGPIRSAGWASWPTCRRARASSSTPAMSAASRSPPCARRPAAATTSNATSTRRSRNGLTTGYGQELKVRLDCEPPPHITTGPSIEKSIAPLRSFVSTPMQHGRLFLAGDAAHIVPPTGAKGLNLAASDVHYLCRALVARYKKRDDSLLGAYSDTALARVWKAERFSWWMTTLLHKLHADDEFRSADAARRARLSRIVPRRPDGARRKLCRPAILTSHALCSAPQDTGARP